MTNEEWNNIQENVYLRLFSSTEGISSKKIIKALERRRNVWKKLYSIVGKEMDPNNKKYSIMGIDKIVLEDKTYLVIRTGLWEFIVININDMRCLDNDEALVLFSDGVFEKFRGIDEDDMHYLSFEKLTDNTLKELVDFYVEEEAVLSDVDHLSFKFYHEDHVIGSYSISYDKSDSMVSINDFNEGRCNYIFLDENLKVYGASNLTGNKETVAKLFDGSRDILIPVHLLGSITDEVVNQVMDDKVMTKNV
jgi:hypothetical protein